MIIKKSHSLELMSTIATIALRKDVYKELGYPIYSDENHTWYLYYDNNVLIGFCSYIVRNGYISLSHDYILPEYRNKGIYDCLFIERFNDIKGGDLKAVSTHKSIHTFLRYGFKIKRQTKNYYFVEHNFNN